MKKINTFLLIFTFLFGIFATNLHSMKREKPDTETTEKISERISKKPRRFSHGLRTFFQKQKSDQTNHFGKLPDELFVKIFEDSNPTKYELINLSKVCSKFHRIALDRSFINHEIQRYKQLLNSDDRVKALLGFKFLIQLKNKSLFFKTLGIDPKTFCDAQYNALIKFFKSLDLRLGNNYAQALEKAILGYDNSTPGYIDNVKYIFAKTLEEYPQKINKHIFLNKKYYIVHANSYSLITIAMRLYRDDDINLTKMLLIFEPKLINTKSADGNTPLHDALKKNSTEIAILLLEHNANFRIKNNIGETAIELAAKLNNPEIDKVLIPKLTWYEKQLFKVTRQFKPRIKFLWQ